jgi:ADP-heptose:LPS heptosyltransferase
MKRTVRKILIRRVDNVGDMVLALPVLRELKRCFKRAEFTLMVKREHRGLLYQYADDFIDPKPASALTRMRRSYDLLFNIECSWPQHYVPKPIGTQHIVHIGTPNWKKPQHIYRHLLDGLAAHGITVRYGRPKIFLSSYARKKAQQWLQKHTAVDDNALTVAVNAGSGFLKKRWPLAGFIKVCKWLIAEFDARIIVLGAVNEDESALKLSASIPKRNAVLLLGEPIEVVAAILSKLDLLIGNDSGPSHVASAVGLPTVTIFGPTSPGLWKPAGKKSVVVFNQYANCIGGYEHANVCEHQQCLTTITPCHVADAILLCLNKYVGRTKKLCLDSIKVSDKLELENTVNGVVLTIRKTGHACLVNHGWMFVSRVLKEVNRTGSFSRTLEKFTTEKDLLEMLLLHRVLVSTSTKKLNRPL